MRLKLQLPAKAGRFHIFECEAVRLVTLPDEEFQDFLNGPHQDGRWAAEPFYADEHGRRIYQGVLVLGEGHKDGVFAYDGGKHFAYLPGARAVVDSILEQAVEKIIREGAENTNEGSWCYYFSELYEQMGLVIEDGNGFDTMLLEKLEQRPEAADVTLTDECFDVCYYLDYCKNLAPEQPAPSLSAERKEEIISGILNYMAEYFDDSSLYDILHNTLEICNDEIGCLGFALYDEYVDEQIEASEVQSDLLPKSGKLVNLLPPMKNYNRSQMRNESPAWLQGLSVTALTQMCRMNGFIPRTSRLCPLSNWRAMKSRRPRASPPVMKSFPVCGTAC